MSLPIIDKYCIFVNDMIHGTDDFKTSQNKENFFNPKP